MPEVQLLYCVDGWVPGEVLLAGSGAGAVGPNEEDGLLCVVLLLEYCSHVAVGDGILFSTSWFWWD